MADVTSLKNAPIKEAQINIKFDQKIDLKLVESYIVNLSLFKKKDPFYSITQTITFGPQAQSKNQQGVHQEHIGYRLFSEDNKKGMVFTVDSIAFSYVESYTGWDNFKAEFDDLMLSLKKAGFPALVKQVGLRFINRLSFDVGEDIGKYLKILPGMPETQFSSTADNLLLRYNVTEKAGGRASVNFIYEGLDQKKQKLLFNFDIFTYYVKSSSVSTDKIDDDLTYLREYKNDIFFSSITNDLKDKYNA